MAWIHSAANDEKYFCHFTGFLEGVACSGHLEVGEIEPLVEECKEFFGLADDDDAVGLITSFQQGMLEHGTVEALAVYRVRQIDPGCTKSNVNRFLGFCRGVVCDGLVTLKEAESILNFLDNFTDLRSVVGVSQIATVCEDAIADGIVDQGESDGICEEIGRLVGDSFGDTGWAQTRGVANFDEYRNSNLLNEFEEANIVLTGCFKTRPRSILEQKLSELGANVCRTVSRKTDFLIIGGQPSRDWIEMHRGTKLRAAQKIRETKPYPRFVSESQILRLLQSK